MRRILGVILIINLIGMVDLNAQSIKMKSYIPQSKAYDIYYPENFTVVEEDGIVSFHNNVSGLNITITSYSVDKNIEEKKLIDLLNGFIKEYYNKELHESDWSIYQTKFDNLIESKFENKGTQWIWWGISRKNHAVLISADKNSLITDDEIKLIRFIIDNLIIN
jgi:hypothetical protein